MSATTRRARARRAIRRSRERERRLHDREPGKVVPLRCAAPQTRSLPRRSARPGRRASMSTTLTRPGRGLVVYKGEQVDSIHPCRSPERSPPLPCATAKRSATGERITIGNNRQARRLSATVREQGLEQGGSAAARSARRTATKRCSQRPTSKFFWRPCEGRAVLCACHIAPPGHRQSGGTLR